MKKEMLEDFIAFAKDVYGLTVEATSSETKDTFESIFGEFLSNQSKTVLISSCDYTGDSSLGIEIPTNSIYDGINQSNIGWAA